MVVIGGVVEVQQGNRVGWTNLFEMIFELTPD